MTTAVYNFVPRQAKHVRVPAPPGGHMQIEDLLLRHGAITEEQLQRAREDQKILGGDLGRILVDLRFITDDLLCRTKAHQLKIPRASPDRLSIAHELLQLIPVQVCEKLGIIAIGRERRDNVLQVATNDPANQEHLKTIAQAVGERVMPVVSTAHSIERAIRRHYYGEPVKAEEPEQPKDSFQESVHPSASDPQFAALLARVEQVEQKTMREGQILQALRAIGDILVESGLVSREDYLRRARGE